MAGIDPGTLGVVLTGSSLYVSLLPKLSDVRRTGPDSETAADVHTGVAMASAVLIGSGALIAYLSGDRRPLAITIGMAALMALVYEVTLRLPGEVPQPRTWGYPT